MQDMLSGVPLDQNTIDIWSCLEPDYLANKIVLSPTELPRKSNHF